MAMHIGNAADDAEVLVDINTTPLIDVMLVLLIMLIITIPIQTHAVKLDMPSGRPPPSVQPQVVRIDVGDDDIVRWNGAAVADRHELDAHLRDVAAAGNLAEVHVHPDPHVKYGRIAMVLASAQRMGVTKLGIVDSGPAPE